MTAVLVAASVGLWLLAGIATAVLFSVALDRPTPRGQQPRLTAREAALMLLLWPAELVGAYVGLLRDPTRRKGRP